MRYKSGLLENIEEGAILVLVRLNIKLKQMGIFSYRLQANANTAPTSFSIPSYNVLENVEPVPNL